MSQIIKGAVVNVAVALKQGGLPYAIALNAAVSAQFTSVDGTVVLIASMLLSSATPGSNWPVGAIIIPLTNAQTNALPIGDVLLRVTVAGLTWLIPMESVATSGGQSALFTKPAGVAALRADLGQGGAQMLIASGLTDDYLWGKLVAAEAQAERLLKCFFNAVEVIPDDAPQAEIDALELAGTRYVQESTFDFENGMFLPDEFGFIQLGHRPVQQVRSVSIRVPSPFLSSFDVPANWFRLNKKHGQLRFFPTTTPIGAPLGAYGVGFMSGGSCPNAISVRYVVGLKNAAGTVSSSAAVIWPDLVELVKKMAILSLLQTSFQASSGSISADGLSQSSTVDTDKWQGVIDTLMYGPKGSNGGLYTAIHGIVMGVLG